MSKGSRSHGSCVFCGNGSVTKQHLWPDWMQAVVPRVGDHHHQMLFQMRDLSAEVVRVTPSLHKSRGPTGSRKIRRFCATCNNEWMSGIENAAKPTMTDLMTGNATELNAVQKRQVAAAAALMTVVAEYTDESSRAIPDGDRDHFWKTQEPPSTWEIWIGVPHMEWRDYRYTHFGATGLKPGSPPQKVHLHLSSFGIGELYIHVRDVPLAFRIQPNHAPRPISGLIKIWPPSEESVSWPPPSEVSDEDILHSTNGLGTEITMKPSK